MREFGLILLGCALLTAQEQKFSQPVRSISIRLISTHSETPNPIEWNAIRTAWKARNVRLAVEQPLDVTAIDTAKEVIHEMYSKSGRSVRVDHKISQMPPRSLEVAFEVVELCSEE